MPESRDVEGLLYATLAVHRNVSVDSVRADVAADGLIDSLEGVELIIAAEAQYDIKFSDSEITSHCRSLPNLTALVSSKISP